MKCNDALLSDALTHEGDSPAMESLSQHLTACPRCRQKMEELAASPAWWHEASTVLGEKDRHHSTILISLESELSPDVLVQVDEVSLNFLGPASHPEMLGRLGRYEVERVVGAGGMGVVLKAFDTELHRPVAIKVLAPHLSHSGAARRRFSREAQAAAAVVHENVIPIYDVQDTSQLPYLVMQFVQGESLQARVDRDGPLSIDEMLRIAAQIATGLAAAHQQGLIHRDVKPANILLQDGTDRVLISDFGLARTADDASLTRTGIVAGTPHYMSPEQARGTAIDCRSDLFGLGSVLYFMLTGHPPFRAEGAMAVLQRICHDPHRPVDEINTHVPAHVSDLLDRLLHKSASHRFASAEVVAHQLTNTLADWRQPARSRNRSSRSSLWRLWQHGILLSACLTLLLAGLSVWTVTWLVRPTAPRSPIPLPNPMALDKRPVAPSHDFVPPPAASVNSPRYEASPAIASEDQFDRELLSLSMAIDEYERDAVATVIESPPVIDPWNHTLYRLDQETSVFDSTDPWESANRRLRQPTINRPVDNPIP